MAALINAVTSMSFKGGSTNYTQVPKSTVGAIAKPKNQVPIVTVIDVIALTTTFVLMAGVIAIMVYAYRRRCDGRRNACEACRIRQRRSLREREDDLEDVELLWDGKDVVGKQD